MLQSAYPVTIGGWLKLFYTRHRRTTLNPYGECLLARSVVLLGVEQSDIYAIKREGNSERQRSIRADAVDVISIVGEGVGRPNPPSLKLGGFDYRVDERGVSADKSRIEVDLTGDEP